MSENQTKKRFTLSGYVTVSAYTVVFAESPEEAIAVSKDSEAVIGGVGSGVLPEESWVIEDADGGPENIRVEAVEP